MLITNVISETVEIVKEETPIQTTIQDISISSETQYQIDDVISIVQETTINKDEQSAVDSPVEDKLNTSENKEMVIVDDKEDSVPVDNATKSENIVAEMEHITFQQLSKVLFKLQKINLRITHL